MKKVFALMLLLTTLVISGCSFSSNSSEDPELTNQEFRYASKIKTGEVEMLPNGNPFEIEISKGTVSFLYKTKGSSEIESFSFYENEIKKGLLILETNVENVNEIRVENGITIVNYHLDTKD